MSSLLALSAHAEVDDLVREAQKLIAAGQMRLAFDLLEPHEVARAGDADYDTVLGISANETGQFTRAVFALERALSVQPGNARARAELGRALFSAGDTEAARRVLKETQQAGIPPEASATIDQFLQAIDRSEEAARSSIKSHVEAVVGYDTNVNSGPGNANVAVPAFGGVIITLSANSVALKDAFIATGGGVSWRQVMNPRWSLIGNVSGNARLNSKYHEFNTGQLDANAGATYRYDQHEFSGVVQAGTYTVNGARARDQQGIVGEWTYRLDGYRQWTTYVQWGQLEYPGQSVRNADRTVLGTSYAHAFRSGLILFTGAYAGEEKQRASSVPHLGHDLFGVRLGAQKAISNDLALFGNAAYEERDYGGTDPLFSRVREDRQLNLSMGLSWTPAKLWRVTPQLSMVSVKSNIPVADFRKTSLSVAVRRDF
ncbi:surface lipoprotein assembly modifier [Polaromonas sp. YR568]|uniref:surface lipoprotein assembly modifier n=1 Tax=Polaromonas sp. YR568 TaxID=1855301 RepID=UPI0031380C32